MNLRLIKFKHPKYFHINKLPEHKIAIISNWPQHQYVGHIIIRFGGDILSLSGGTRWTLDTELPAECMARLLEIGETIEVTE